MQARVCQTCGEVVLAEVDETERRRRLHRGEQERIQRLARREGVRLSPSGPDHCGLPAADLSEQDLLRELEHLHRTRHETFLHGSTQALVAHSDRLRELEDEYLRRHPSREVDPERLRWGARRRRAR